MTCGKGAKPAATQCKVSAGSSIKLQYGHDRPGDDIIADSHVGPCNVYLVPASNGGGNAPTKGWFKIYQGVWDPQSKWCMDKLRGQKGLLTVPIPSNLKSGSYVLRTEFNALHEANQRGKAQFYVFCIDISVSGRGNGLPSRQEIVSIPGYLTPETPGVMFNVYQGNPKDSGSKYPQLGPQVSKLVAQSDGAKKNEESTQNTEESTQNTEESTQNTESNDPPAEQQAEPDQQSSDEPPSSPKEVETKSTTSSSKPSSVFSKWLEKHPFLSAMLKMWKERHNH